MPSNPPDSQLQTLDTLGRPLGSLRISVTDRCNLRCAYCMPEEHYVWLPKQSLLTFEELTRVARIFVGLGAIVMSNTVIESDGMLAAGAMLTGGKRIGARQLWSGRPASFMRDLTDAALVEMQRGVQHYVANGQAHKAAILGQTEA